MLAVVLPLLGLGLFLGVEALIAALGDDVDPPVGIDGCVGCAPGGPPPQRIAYLGDSTVAGTGASSPEGTIPVQVARLLGRPVQILDLAVSGARVKDVLEDQVGPALDAFRPEIVIISVGANDSVHMTPRGTFRDRYRDVVRRLPDAARVVLLGVPDLGSPPRLLQPLRAIAGFRGRQLDQDVGNLAADVGAAYAEIDTLGPKFRSNDGDFFSADEYHPSDAGYALWSQLVAQAITG